MEVLELLGHPVRLRIVHAMRGGRTLTTARLCALLPDVSKAMLYRHVDLLTAGGVLEVAAERRVRGAVERHYRLRQDRASIDPDAARSLSPDDHRRGFAAAVAALVAEFNAYLDRDNADPTTDPVGYRQHAVWLTRDELHAMISELREAIVPRLANPPTPDRTRYLLSPILFPSAEAPTDTDQQTTTPYQV
jgi:DNA-binding transcriptional ArsR family regulator